MRLLYALCFLFIIGKGNSQEINGTWSTTLNKSSTEVISSIIADSDTTYLIIKQDLKEKNIFSFEQLDSNKNSISNKKIELPAKILHLDLINNHVIAFTPLFNPTTKEDELSAYAYNLKGELVSTIELFKYKANGNYHNTFVVTVSSNKEKIGVLCEKAFKTNKNESVVIKVLDKKLELLYSKEHEYDLPIFKKKINVPVINNKGTLYIAKRIRTKKGNQYYVTTISKSNVFKEKELKLKSRKIADLKYDLTPEGGLVVAGIYSSYGKYNFEGVFCKRYGDSLAQNYPNEYMLPEWIVSAFKSKKEISKLGYGLDHFHVLKVLLDEKENIYLVTEHVSIERTDEQKTDTRKGIVVTKFNNLGQALWIKSIKTNQIDSKEQGYWSSFLVDMLNGKLVIAYNLVGEKNKKVINEFGENTNMGLIVKSFNSKGELQNLPTKNIFNGLPEKVSLNPKYYLLQNDQLILVSENAQKENYYLGAFTIEK